MVIGRRSEITELYMIIAILLKIGSFHQMQIVT